MSNYFHKHYGDSMDPYGSWQLQASGMGPSTNPQDDQLKEFNLDANWGAKNIEIGFLDTKKLEGFPKPAAREVKRLAKLTGVKPSVHGPLEDPAGFDPLKKEQKEHARQGVVSKYTRAMKVAHDTGGAKTPVVFHTSNYLPGDVYSKHNGAPIKESSVVMDKETGKASQIVEREEKLDRSGEKIKYTPEMQIQMINNTAWSEAVRKLAEDRKNVEEIREQDFRGRTMAESEDKLKWKSGATLSWLSHVEANILNTYHDFAKYMPKMDEIDDPGRREDLRQVQDLTKECRNFHNSMRKKEEELIKKARKAYKKGDETAYSLLNTKLQELKIKDIDNWQQLFSFASSKHLTPRRYTSVEDYTLEPAAKTFAQTALNAYNKYGEDAPRVMIENAPAPNAFSSGKKHREMVEKARELLVKESKGKVSKKKAEKLIQATLDVGHFGLWKQYGFTDDDIIKMAKKVAPITGHLHITDNFGSADAHLPPGWGNLPHGKVTELLKKHGFKGRTIIEAGGAEAAKYHPYLQSLEYFNSGIYSMSAKPSWTQTGDYFFSSSGYSTPGTSLPPVHQNQYGAGFSQLPPMSPVGGKKQRSNMSGTPYS